MQHQLHISSVLKGRETLLQDFREHRGWEMHGVVCALNVTAGPEPEQRNTFCVTHQQDTRDHGSELSVELYALQRITLGNETVI